MTPMDKSIPSPAAKLLAFIYKTETGKNPPACYEVIYGQNQGKLPKPITSMTIREISDAQPNWTKRFGSSASGAPQIMRDTMDKPDTTADLVGQMGLTGSELFDADMQDRMAFHLLKRRGYDQFMAGRIGVVAFGKRLAQEWASFPVLATTKGAHRQVERGQSYYAGDGVNKALVAPETIEALLAEVKVETRQAPTPAPAEQRPDGAAITDKDVVAQVQARLFELGYTEIGSRNPDGSFDGKVGPLTRTAILAFRNENGLPVVDYIDQAMRIALLDAKRRVMAPARADAKPAEVREQVPEAKAAWWTQIGAWVLGIPAAIGGVVSGAIDNLDGSRGYLEPVKQFAGDIPPWVWFLALFGIAAAIWWKSRAGQVASTIAYQTGERR